VIAVDNHERIAVAVPTLTELTECAWQVLAAKVIRLGNIQLRGVRLPL
jgi:hypothetical protein